MNLDPVSVEWAIDSLHRRSDTDLFPRPVELEAVVALRPKSASVIAALEISQHQPAAPRRFIVPKDDLSYRAATQLDPLDSIILTALIHEHGAGIEARRVPVSANVVFSYRFAPTADGELYPSTASWNSFWAQCFELSKIYSHALLVDITDFYNQVSHHTVENQLNESGLPNQATKWILRLLAIVCANVSRGLPVGPHAVHILAEASLIPVDNSLLARGAVFCRYVDDFVVFAKSEAAAREALYQIAEILDKQQRLHLQRSKTRILTSQQLQAHCESMIEDRPLNDLERDLLEIIRRHSGGEPYRTILLSALDDAELRSFREDSVHKILNEYLSDVAPDFVHLRWFLRRLAQVGHPAAVSFCLQNLDALVPALSDVCHYFVGVSSADATVDWSSVGEALLAALSSSLIQSNEYFQLSMLGLFSREARLDHVSHVISQFRGASPAIRREIILAAAACGQVDWLRELKEDVPGMDVWTKRAYLYATILLPADERRFFLRSLPIAGTLEEFIKSWAS